MPYRKQVNAKPLKSSSSAVTSSTAKRILDTLEMMATPLSVSLIFLSFFFLFCFCFVLFLFCFIMNGTIWFLLNHKSNWNIYYFGHSVSGAQNMLTVSPALGPLLPNNHLLTVSGNLWCFRTESWWLWVVHVPRDGYVNCNTPLSSLLGLNRQLVSIQLVNFSHQVLIWGLGHKLFSLHTSSIMSPKDPN